MSRGDICQTQGAAGTLPLPSCSLGDVGNIRGWSGRRPRRPTQPPPGWFKHTVVYCPAARARRCDVGVEETLSSGSHRLKSAETFTSSKSRVSNSSRSESNLLRNSDIQRSSSSVGSLREESEESHGPRNIYTLNTKRCKTNTKPPERDTKLPQ